MKTMFAMAVPPGAIIAGRWRMSLPRAALSLSFSTRMPSLPRPVRDAAREGFAIVHRKHKRAQQHYGPDATPVDEVFAVLAGEVECLCGRRWLPAVVGDAVCVR